ncbi:hypothetical protein [Rhizobium leguminosarum]|uniref:hypothetical protein n=1 Tax=Rhizobium leguminosarum TaxID=384 RepID=UPI001F3FD005|nr:hypothetical protein [Rhizobium leguminosarum]UIK19372.1 hypothetical protein LZK79_10290 [Rhizobium leguminosarum]
MRNFCLACLVVIGVFTGARSASAYILTYDDFHKINDTCSGTTAKQADLMIGEAFAFVQSAIANGSADLLTLRGTFTLTRSTLPNDDSKSAIAFADCVLAKASDVLGRAGVRVIRDISERDPVFMNRSFAFFPTLPGFSISSYQLVRVRNDRKTHVIIEDVTCSEPQFAVAYVAFPLDSLQPGLEPSPHVFQPISGGKMALTLDRASPEVNAAIQESFDAIDDMIWLNTNEKPTYRKNLQNFIDKHQDELWLWVNVSSKDKSCSAQMSVQEE